MYVLYVHVCVGGGMCMHVCVYVFCVRVVYMLRVYFVCMCYECGGVFVVFECVVYVCVECIMCCVCCVSMCMCACGCMCCVHVLYEMKEF